MSEKTIYIDVDKQKLVNANGVELARYPEIGYKENLSLEFHLITVSGSTVTAFDVSSATFWQFDAGPSTSFNDADKPSWCKTLNSGIDSSGAASGIISVEINANTAEFLAGIGSGTEQKQIFFELTGYSADEKMIYRFRVEGRAKGTLADSGVPEELEDEYVKKFGAADIEITDYTKGIILRTSDGTRARITLVKDNDILTIKIEELT